MRKVILGICFFYLISEGFGQSRTKVNAIKIDDSFDSISAHALSIAIVELEEVINSEKFAKAVKQEQFNVGNYNLTSDEIYEIIISGMDNYKGKPKDFSIDLRVAIFDEYYGYDNIGITNMGTRITRTHRCYILKSNIKCYISHLAHEYMHQIGFYDNRTWWFGTKTKSVPYKIGDIIDKLIDNSEICAAVAETCKK